MNTPLNDMWPVTAPAPITHALLRVTPDDFVVEEQIDIRLTGAGEHLWVQVRKRGWNTDAVARTLARAANVAPRAVSFAGMKDRHAVTTQWFSIHLPGRETPSLALPDGIEILLAQRHTRKLQRGALAANRFCIRLRECVGDREGALARAVQIGEQGVPNYFGEQRFGRDSGNLDHARRMFAGETVRDRHLRGVYLSAARSLLFNEVLGQRVEACTWNTALDGDAFVLNGTNSFFVPEMIDDVIRRRVAECDIHPSGPLWGEGSPPSRSTVLSLEAAVGERYGDLAHGLAVAGLAHERRPLRLVVSMMKIEWIDTTTLQAAFSLPPGSYATTVLREFAHYRDQAQRAG